MLQRQAPEDQETTSRHGKAGCLRLSVWWWKLQPNRNPVVCLNKDIVIFRWFSMYLDLAMLFLGLWRYIFLPGRFREDSGCVIVRLLGCPWHHSWWGTWGSPLKILIPERIDRSRVGLIYIYIVYTSCRYILFPQLYIYSFYYILYYIYVYLYTFAFWTLDSLQRMWEILFGNSLEVRCSMKLIGCIFVTSTYIERERENLWYIQ